MKGTINWQKVDQRTWHANYGSLKKEIQEKELPRNLAIFGKLAGNLHLQPLT